MLLLLLVHTAFEIRHSALLKSQRASGGGNDDDDDDGNQIEEKARL